MVQAGSKYLSEAESCYAMIELEYLGNMSRAEIRANYGPQAACADPEWRPCQTPQSTDSTPSIQ